MMKLILITHPRASILEMGWYSLSHCAPWDFPLPAAFVIPLSFPMVLSPLLTLHWVEHILLSLFCSWEVVFRSDCYERPRAIVIGSLQPTRHHHHLHHHHHHHDRHPHHHHHYHHHHHHQDPHPRAIVIATLPEQVDH